MDCGDESGTGDGDEIMGMGKSPREWDGDGKTSWRLGWDGDSYFSVYMLHASVQAR